MSNPSSVEKTNEDFTNDFLSAFKKCFGESAKEDAFKLIDKEGPMLIKYKDEIYEVDSLSNLEAYAKETLTTVDEAATLPPEYWILLAEQIHLSSEFISALIDEFRDVKEYEVLNMALNLSNNAGKSEQVFWGYLKNMGEMDVYPKGIVTASKIYNIDVLVDELVELIISNPTALLADMNDDFFETVDLERTPDDGESYYIYRVDPGLWS